MNQGQIRCFKHGFHHYKYWSVITQIIISHRRTLLVTTYVTLELVGIMKYLFVLACVVVGVIAADKYTDKYDNTDLKEILENKRLLLAYFNCVMEKGKCTPDGKELKDNIQDGLETGCEKCTQKQEDGVVITVEHLIEHEPELWDELTNKFDPTGKWRKHYEERAKAKGIKIPSNYN